MACNPKVQYNDFTGDGVETRYTFTFPYLNTADVQVRYGTTTEPDTQTFAEITEYYVDPANPTVLVFNTAPTGPFRIFRCTYDQALEATFQAGSAIRAADLNTNFEQMLFIVQDANQRSIDALNSADGSTGDSTEAIQKANEAIETANDAKETAENAEEIAQNALDLIVEQVAGETVPDIPSLPAQPFDGAIYTVLDSTGVENLTPMTNFPDGLVGASDVSCKLQWDTNTWLFLQAYSINPDARYDARYIRSDWSIYPLLP